MFAAGAPPTDNPWQEGTDILLTKRQVNKFAWVTFLLAGIVSAGGCETEPVVLLEDESTEAIDQTRYVLVARFAHITDAQIVDEESPARLTTFAQLSTSAWRPQEAYSLHLLDGMIRTVNKMHIAQGKIDFLVHTGDAADNAQVNEIQWFVDVMDGKTVDPLTGPDNRSAIETPDPTLDPHRPFAAQGLYRNGIHGTASTIPWYAVAGNHDLFAVGIFPIVTDVFGNRTSPLPLDNRIGLFAPVVMRPTGSLAWGAISPTNPGPPPEVSLPELITPNPARRYATLREFVEIHSASMTEPAGHGFDPENPEKSWYSVSPTPGLRLIGLNSSDPWLEIPEQVYSEGAISSAQIAFLETELASAESRGEIVIVATHHPSDSLELGNGSAVSPVSFREILRDYPCVVLHLAGHWHTSATIDRNGFVELVTGSIIDAPQEGRIVEIWKTTSDDSPNRDVSIKLRYRNFSHLDTIEPSDEADAAIFEDPLLEMREIAANLAGGG